jgi:uncharacterized membrane protein YhaH (DUF805 family)
MAELSPVDWALRPLNNYAKFSGRAPRAEYWWFYLATIVVGFAVDIVDKIGGDTGWIGAIFNLALIVPTIAVTVRRLHDTDRSGWWLLAGIAPIAAFAFFAAQGIFEGSDFTFTPSIGISLFLSVVAAVLLFIFMVLPGTQGPNSYGDDPHGPSNLEEIFA